MNDSRTVVVGVGVGESDGRVLRYALAEGERRGAVVRVVGVVPPPSRWQLRYAECEPASLLFSPLPQEEMRADVERRIGHLVDGVRSTDSAFGDVAVTIEVLDGHPAQVLVEQARTADLLVVGHRGRTLASGAGSVALACVLHATVPVAVVRPDMPYRDTARAPVPSTAGA